MKPCHDHSAKGDFGLNEYLHNAKCMGYRMRARIVCYKSIGKTFAKI